MIVLAAPDLPGWVYLVASWPICFYGIWVLWNAVRDRSDRKSVERSLAWPEEQGYVVSSKIVWGHVEVDYKYWVSGEDHEGKRKFNLPPAGVGGVITIAARLFMNAANQHMDEYPAGAKVVVRYNPAKPEDSVLCRRSEVSQPNHDGLSRE
jgi:Protein of unknown function (DUF3592)